MSTSGTSRGTRPPRRRTAHGRAASTAARPGRRERWGAEPLARLLDATATLADRPLLIFDVKRRRITHWSRSLRELLGFGERAQSADFEAPDLAAGAQSEVVDLERSLPLWEAGAVGSVFDGEWRLAERGGDRLLLLGRETVLERDAGGRVSLVAVALSAPQAARGLPDEETSGARAVRELARITDKINAGLTLEEVLDQVYLSFRGLIPYDRIGCALLDGDAGRIVARWARSEATEVKIGRGYSGALAGSSLERILASGQPRILNDLERYAVEHPDSESTRLILAEGIRASLTCPLVAEGRPIGFLFFSSRLKNAYADLHVDLFRQIAGQLATIVEKAGLLELDQMRSRFLGMAAHDLRNPIAAIAAWSELLGGDDQSPLTPKQLEAVDEISRLTQVMSNMVNDILGRRAIESGVLDLTRETTDLKITVLEAVAENGLAARRKGVVIAFDCDDPGPVEAEVDPHRLRQALSNLISNGVKFSHPGGRVVVGLESSMAEVTCWVRDAGVGIAADELHRIFEEFPRTSSRPTGRESGIGLGLSIAKRIVESHGGTISATSEPGKGSCFRFILPRSPASPAGGSRVPSG